MAEDIYNETLEFDFTPDPRVLIALSHTSMLPMDALCELVDNAIDSFHYAKLQGVEIPRPMVVIDLPKKSEIEKGIGMLRVRDNGPGMTPEQAEKAIKAGYSGNNSFDTLGLFGMGFNISTSKFGRVTSFLTARPEDEFCTTTVIDLEKIDATKSYKLGAKREKKPENFEHGTMIEITGWWPEGNANSAFIKKLVQYGKPKIMEELGRRYATILRKKEVIIYVGGEPCEAFEHCVWGSNRYVERNGKQIPARYDIDELVGTKRRCSACRTIIPDNMTECPSCHSTMIRTVEERVTGWVGIQRFDDSSRYGIDLIRNGRAIRLAEKAAFFEYVDDLKNVIKDYPIDGPYGRIVGEINLDFVPVDFLKQDFQRSSDEWAKAMKVLRGESSLQPKQPGADKNTSYIFKLYQGYRKVRECGKADMYMGFWDPSDKDDHKAKRISRSEEREYYEKFKKKIPGYYDDAEWWKRVEEASKPPVEQLVTCPDCLTQNMKESEVCVGCGKILIGKTCINPECGAFIEASAVVCSKCGASQIPKIAVPWTCNVCGKSNSSDRVVCVGCGKPKGALNPLSYEYLVSVSNKDDDLSINNLTVTLADGNECDKLQVETLFSTEPLISPRTSQRLPMVTFKQQVGELKIVIDPSHKVFSECKTQKEELIASEIASYIFDVNRNLVAYPEHSISSISWSILYKYWLGGIEISFQNLKERCNTLLALIKQRLATTMEPSDASQLYVEMDSRQQKEFVSILMENGVGLDKVGELKENGGYLAYVPADFLLKVYDSSPKSFFNKNVWDVQYDIDNPDINEEILRETYEKTMREYKNSLESVVLFCLYPSNEPLALRKVESAIVFLENRLEE